MSGGCSNGWLSVVVIKAIRGKVLFVSTDKERMRVNRRTKTGKRGWGGWEKVSELFMWV